MNRAKLMPIAVGFGLFVAVACCGSSRAADEARSGPLENWQYPKANFSATIRKNLHSANAQTEESLEKVLDFYKERMEAAKKTTRDLQAMESSSGSISSTQAAGEPTMTIGWVLLRTAEQTICIHLVRSSTEKVTHISVVLDQR